MGEHSRPTIKQKTRIIFAALALTALTPPAASTDEPDQQNRISALVVIMSMQRCCPEEAWPEAELHIKNEFEALGWQVEVADGAALDEHSRRLELEAAAREKSAACAIRVARASDISRMGVDLWIGDQITGKTLVKHVPITGEADSDAASMVALETIEALRASLIELKVDAVKKERAPVPREVEDLVQSAQISKTQLEKEEPLGWRVGMGVGAVWDPRFAGAWAAARMGAAARLHSRFWLMLDGAVSMAGTDIKGEGTGAALTWMNVRVWGLLEILDRGLIRPEVGLGAGPVMVVARGFGSTQYKAVTDFGISCYLGGLARVGFAINERLRLTLGLRFGAIVPQMQVFFGDEEVAKFGLPFLDGFLGVDLFL